MCCVLRGSPFVWQRIKIIGLSFSLAKLDNMHISSPYFSIILKINVGVDRNQAETNFFE